MKTTNPYGFNIVGIGASAGGLRALTAFFENMPTNTGTSFVVVQHLSPDHKSLMSELLGKSTSLAITEVRESTKVKPNNIYLIPPGKNIRLKSNTLELTDKPTDRSLNLPIDIFLDSLATARKNHAAAIILSGTGSDGTGGIKSIHAYNGLVIAQDPEDAEFDGMIQSAIDTGLVDYVLPANKIPEMIADFTVNPEEKFGIEHEVYADKTRYEKVLSHLVNAIDKDFSHFKKPTLVRRIARRIQISKQDSFKSYFDLLLKDDEEARLLAKDFLINVTDFFRDKDLWRELEFEIIPDLVESCHNGGILKFWVMACSTGEEAYSYAMQIDREIKKREKNIVVKIFATDIDEKNIEIAARGEYSAKAVEKIEPSLRFQNFDQLDNGVYKVKEHLRSMVIFSTHDALNDPPFTKCNLVSCRNLLIYLNKEAQERLIRIIQYAMMLRSILVLGRSETLGHIKDSFLEMSASNRVYKNLSLSKSLYKSDITLGKSVNAAVSMVDKNRQISGFDLNHFKYDEVIAKGFTRHLDYTIIYADANLNIIHAMGKLNPYLNIPKEGFSQSLFDLLPQSLKPKLNLALIKAEKTKENVTLEVSNSELESAEKSYNLIITHAPEDPSQPNGKYIAIFSPTTLKTNSGDTFSASSSDLPDESFQLLESELAEARQSLATMQLEIEMRNEELQTTNEELLATNEELQSTNEELQSVNEELHTVNAELNVKVNDLRTVSATIDNILKSTEINTLVVGKQLDIKSFTTGIRSFFNISQTDIGRDLRNFSNKLGSNSDLLFSNYMKVIETGETIQEELKFGDIWYLMRLTPFIQSDQTIDGVVTTFIDISYQKSVQFELERKETEIRELFDNAPDMFFAVNADGKIINANLELLEKLEYDSRDEVIGKSVLEIAPGFTEEELQYDLDKLMNGKLLRDESRIVQTKTGKKIPIRVNAKSFFNEDGSLNRVLASWRDVSQLKAMEDKLQDQNAAFEQVLESTLAGYWDWDIPGNTEYMSPTFKSMFGYEDHEIPNTPDWWQENIHPDDLPGVFEVFNKHVATKGKVPYDNEVRYFHKNGDIVWVWCKGKVIEWDEEGNPLRMVGSHVNITHLKNLTDSNKQLERFAYVASHDLQEPLRTVTDFVKLFKEDYSEKLDSQALTYLEFIDEASIRMGSLIKGILAYSRVSDNAVKESVDLNETLKAVLQDLKIKIDQEKAEFKIGKLPKIAGYAVELHSLFLNLIGNAIKFVAPNTIPEITIAAKKVDGHHQISIKDNGIGIDPKDQDKIFDIFKRLHNEEDYSGTGIGLAHCKKIVEMHGGKIWVKSELGKGCTFYFNFKA
ncbi:chemotaxis protein CheB [Gilvibacter sediminis]|uniref:chemotaxis protein CheB n=1 Tax=Gilvibacter sediminis TaxID=379071 RepID=UPI00234FF494|nr:chemotaxis protein CheB [Gilvibacter sediminis]MDC7996512.1 chemotaxis protein CheB [Gilvibacter sediminis]